MRLGWQVLYGRERDRGKNRQRQDELADDHGSLGVQQVHPSKRTRRGKGEIEGQADDHRRQRRQCVKHPARDVTDAMPRRRRRVAHWQARQHSEQQRQDRHVKRHGGDAPDLLIAARDEYEGVAE